MAKRESRSTAVDTQPDMLKPLDLSVFGGPDDPCFGLYHDLKATECRECGDREICAIAMAQKRRVERVQIEREQPFKDIEDRPKTIPDARLTRYMLRKLEKGFEKDYILTKTQTRFDISEEKAREIFKQAKQQYYS